jgi:hypothetical protein
MTIAECEFPAASSLDRTAVQAAYFHDSYRAPLRRQPATMVDIFFAIFGHQPAWMKWVLIARNRVASWCGLEAPTASEILNVQRKSRYAVGEKIGVWPIYSLTADELVAGRNNKHLDFRLSVLREADDAQGSVVVSTICTVHNAYGKIYLFFIVPFHRWGVRQLLSRAVRAGRL